tara:strand:- start:652 stop:1020 length:369 start_codon:yes stop_codon:yes gene_type:complete
MKKNWTKKELKEFKDYIMNKRNECVEELEQSKGRADNMVQNESTSAIYSSHMADAGSDQQEIEKAFYWVARENKFIQYLNRALDKIDDGTFGICSSCNSLINKERLLEVPHTNSCFECKNKS